MSLDEAIGKLEAAVAAGADDNEVSDLVDDAIGGDCNNLKEVVARCSGLSNIMVPRAISATLGMNCDGMGPCALDNSNANLIWDVVSNMCTWDDAGTTNNCIGVIRSQTVMDLPWDPEGDPPEALIRFLLHCLSAEEDSSSNIQETALDTIFQLNTWADSKGGLSAIFSESQREEIRAEVMRQGIEEQAKPLLDLL